MSYVIEDAALRDALHDLSCAVTDPCEVCGKTPSYLTSRTVTIKSEPEPGCIPSGSGFGWEKHYWCKECLAKN